MRTLIWVLTAVVLVSVGCARSANVEQERTALMAADRDWSQTTKDPDKFVSFVAADASFYPPGMPVVKGQAAVKDTFKQMSSAPGFTLQWSADKAEISGAGDIGYTTGTYQATQGGGSEKGKYVTVWKKQADLQWKVVEDIFNADAIPAPPPGQHAAFTPAKITWGPAPPSLPAGAKMAVISGDPSQSVPFVIRAQLPAGYTIAPHWHPTDEHVTVVSGTFAFGMGDTLDKAAMQDLPSGGYALMPAQMRHYALAKTATTIQVHGMGPLVINYVNPADDPSQAKK
jgi:ketosteroid isomerase-like protein/quercetin dioxygenase-like cupin family protein